MELFQYKIITENNIVFSPYLHKRIGKSRGVTLFVSAILAHKEQYNWVTGYSCDFEFMNSYYGITRNEFDETLHWLKSCPFSSIEVQRVSRNKVYDIKISKAGFYGWLMNDISFFDKERFQHNTENVF